MQTRTDIRRDGKLMVSFPICDLREEGSRFFFKWGMDKWRLSHVGRMTEKNGSWEPWHPDLSIHLSVISESAYNPIISFDYSGSMQGAFWVAEAASMVAERYIKRFNATPDQVPEYPESVVTLQDRS